MKQTFPIAEGGIFDSFVSLTANDAGSTKMMQSLIAKTLYKINVDQLDSNLPESTC